MQRRQRGFEDWVEKTKPLESVRARENHITASAPQKSGIVFVGGTVDDEVDD